MKLHKILLVLVVFFLSFSSNVIAQQEKGENFSSATVENNKIVKFAWEIPEYTELKNSDGSYMYPFARSYAWSEIRHAGEAFVLMSQVRTVANTDSQDFGASIAFRPFALDFGNCAISFGVAYGGQVVAEEDPDEVFRDFFQEGPFTVHGTEFQGNTASGKIQTMAFSTFGSFPTLGMQMALDFGYAWTEATIETERITGLIDFSNFPIPIIYDKYRYRQRREGLFFRCEFRKFFTRDPDFNVLNFVSLSFFTIYHKKTTMRHSKAKTVTWDLSAVGAPNVVMHGVEFPSTIKAGFLEFPLIDPFDPDATSPSNKIIDSNITAGDLLVRLYTSPLMDIGLLKQGISVDFLGTVSHTTGEIAGDNLHGVTLSMGGQLSLFDIILISYTYTWEMNNDQDDFTTLAIGVGLYG